MNKVETRFGERLRALREESGLSQYQLAAGMGVSRGLLGNYERGSRRPNHQMLCAIADYFGVTVEYMLGLTDERKGASLPAGADELLCKYLQLSEEGRRDLLKQVDMLLLWESSGRSSGE